MSEKFASSPNEFRVSGELNCNDNNNGNNGNNGGGGNVNTDCVTVSGGTTGT